MKKIVILLTTLTSFIFTVAQNVGIGTTSPGFPLNFSNITGDKISLYRNSGNHYGFGIQSALLQIQTDLAASNIAFGHGEVPNGTYSSASALLSVNLPQGFYSIEAYLERVNDTDGDCSSKNTARAIIQVFPN